MKIPDGSVRQSGGANPTPMGTCCKKCRSVENSVPCTGTASFCECHTPTPNTGTEEMVKEHLLANFCDGDTWKEADASTFTKHGALDIAKYFYDLALTHDRSRLVEEVEKKIRSHYAPINGREDLIRAIRKSLLKDKGVK